jgi:hypothetical protein
MNQPAAVTPPPQIIYLIRHGEKPVDPPPVAPGDPPPAPVPPFGVDDQGNQNVHSLLPRGWQRSGALAALFAPAAGEPQAGLQTPATLISPFYGDQAKTALHRTHQTIQGLSDRLGSQFQIVSTFSDKQDADLAGSVVSNYSGVVLICWEHHNIPAIASALPTAPGTVIPQMWPDDRFDVIWTFTLDPAAASVQYAFGQVPQQLLSGDSGTVITA